MVGRDKELQFLNGAFDGTQLDVVSLRAWGGVGKSTLVNKWCEYLAADNFRGAKRCGMRLSECDAHLQYARLALVEGKPDAALHHFQSTDVLVTEYGYHRRDGEITELKEKLGL